MGSASEALQPIRGCTAVLTFLHVIPLYCFFFAFWQFADAKFATYKSDAFDRRLRDKGLTALIHGFLNHWWDIWGSNAEFVCAAVRGTSSRTTAVAIPLGMFCCSAKSVIWRRSDSESSSSCTYFIFSVAQLVDAKMAEGPPNSPQEIAACVAMDLWSWGIHGFQGRPLFRIDCSFTCPNCIQNV